MVNINTTLYIKLQNAHTICRKVSHNITSKILLVHVIKRKPSELFD